MAGNQIAMNDIQNKQAIQKAVQAFSGKTVDLSSRNLFAALGYGSDRRISIDSVEAFCKQFDPENRLDHAKAYKAQWKSIHLLFQLTDSELSNQLSLFPDKDVKPGLLQSYVFFAINLTGNDYPRSTLASITRHINQIFPMPVMILFKMAENISIAVINRRQHKREESKDVLGKVTLIHKISLLKPHPGHIDILASFSTFELAARRKSISNFDELHEAWEEVFNVELLNKRFYRELSNWYVWARQNVKFPDDLENNESMRNSTSVIRLLTRLIFCWFLKEKGLIGDALFERESIVEQLISLKDTESSYYRAILQNLFFATLNQPMNAKGKISRQFAEDQNLVKNRAPISTKNLYRYKDYFKDPAKALAFFEDIPFLNGGLFACLDPEDETKKIYADGFSRNPKKQPTVPNFLFFSDPRTVDLSEEFGEAARSSDTVRGLLHILRNYKFTIAENTPVEQEIALDPELLGKVFENLLASYNPETGNTARKQTGSFYTPRTIVDYMVDESLKAYLSEVLQKKGKAKNQEEALLSLDVLFAYTDVEQPFSEEEIDVLIEAIDNCNILDPACGSGAFPMGILHKLVFILAKLDPHNEKWRDRQIAKAEEIEDSEARDSAIEAIERDFDDNSLDYGRKLYLIENCIYGIDIQPIAIQISKLRFFISLVCDQKGNRDKSKNHGIRPLPNLETKFVSADTLIPLTRDGQLNVFAKPKVQSLEKELEKVRHRYFSAQSRADKRRLQLKDADLCQQIIAELNQLTFVDMDRTAPMKIASWNPYDHYSAAEFFNAEWMFGSSLAGGFDIVIGNPPYGAEISTELRQRISSDYHFQDYQPDTYLLFIERGWTLLKPKGVLSYIVPNTWLASLMLTSIRKLIFDKTAITSLVNVKSSVFAAVVDTTIMTFRHHPTDGNEFPILQYTDDGFNLTFSLAQAEWAKTNGAPVNLSLSPALAKVAASLDQFPTLGDFVKVTQGSKLYQKGKGKPKQTKETVQTKPFTCDHRKDKSFRPLLRGKHVNRYTINWSDLWVSYGDWLAEPRYTASFDAPQKIVIRQTGDSLIAAIDYQQFITMDNLYTIIPLNPSVELAFILAALNSKLLKWFYQNVINDEQGEPLAQVKKGHLMRLPVPKISASDAALFNNLVLLLQEMKNEAATDEDISAFLELLIEAAILEVYFPEYVKTKNLGVIAEIQKATTNWKNANSPTEKITNFSNFCKSKSESKSALDMILTRIPADSPEFLGVFWG